MQTPSIPVLAASLALLLVPGIGVQAQALDQEMPDPPSQEELVTFTEAYIEVIQVQDDLNQRISAAESQEAANALQEEANQEVMTILDEHDLEPDRYREITVVLNADAELRAEFEEIFIELTEGA